MISVRLNQADDAIEKFEEPSVDQLLRSIDRLECGYNHRSRRGLLLLFPHRSLYSKSL